MKIITNSYTLKRKFQNLKYDRIFIKEYAHIIQQYKNSFIRNQDPNFIRIVKDDSTTTYISSFSVIIDISSITIILLKQ